MNKKLCLLASLVLLASCSSGNGAASSSSSASSSESSASRETSSSTENSSQSSQEQSEIKQRLTSLKEELADMEGSVNRSSTTLKRVFTYPSDGIFEMTVNSAYESIRYKRDSSFLVESKGSEQVEDSEALTYTYQIYDNGKKITAIRQYSDGASSKNTYAYSTEAAEQAYSLSFVATESANIDEMIANADSELVSIELSDIEVSKGTYSYSYVYSTYNEEDGDKILSTRYTYENKVSLSSGLATHLSQKFVGEIFSGNVENIITAESEVDYFQGEFSEFSGELLS